MIGAEINEVIEEYSSPDRHVTLIGPPALCQRYSLALLEAGMTSTMSVDGGIAAFQTLGLSYS
jgi:2-dehydro-3-deoxygalactonokinase